MLGAGELRPRAGAQCDRRAVHRNDHLRRLQTVAAALLLAGAGCGSGTEGDQTDGLSIAALGDSITAGSPAYDPDPEARAALGFGDDQRSQFEYWAERAEPRLAFENCGVFGERTDEIAARLEPCVDAAGAEILIVQGGINDVAQGRPVADAADDLRAMVERGEELGLEVAIANVLPWNNGHPAADEPIAELNRRVAAIAGDEDVALLDFHATLEDPQRPGLMRADLTSDGDHPSIAGYRRLGELVAAELEPLVP